MAKKMNPFAILDKCPEAGPLIAQCKQQGQKTVEDIPEPDLVDNGDGTVMDKKNHLLWMKTEIPDQKLEYKKAVRFANGFEGAGKSGWRLPTLPELKSILTDERRKNESGKRSYIHPVFNDGPEWNQYWTSTNCVEVTFIKDKFGKKHCQEGESSAWFVHFKLGAIGWNFKTSTNQLWLVLDLQG